MVCPGYPDWFLASVRTPRRPGLPGDRSAAAGLARAEATPPAHRRWPPVLTAAALARRLPSSYLTQPIPSPGPQLDEAPFRVPSWSLVLTLQLTYYVRPDRALSFSVPLTAR